MAVLTGFHCNSIVIVILANILDRTFPASRGSFPGVCWQEKRDFAMGRKWLWFNRRPQPWTALFKTHAPCVVRWPQLAPVASRAFLYINSAVIYWAHIVNMACSSACSKEFNRKELQSLLSSVLDNLDDGKVKKLSDEQFKALFHFLNGRDTFACLPTGHGKTLIYQIAVFVARLGNEPYLTWTKCH